MADELEFLFDKIANNDSPGYEDTELSVILNKAQERFVYKNYGGTNPLKEGFEETEKRRKDLSELTANSEITTASTTQTGVLTNGTFFDLPANFLYAISEEVTITSTDACYNNKRIKVKPITHDQYVANVDNPFKKPYEGLTWRMDYSRVTDNTNPKRHELITNGSYTIAKYHLRYLRRPPAIVVNRTTPASQVSCILDESTHRRIIDIAVELALENTQDQRLPTNVALNQMNE